MPDDDELQPEQHAHMTGAAMRLMVSWLETVLDSGDLSGAWQLVDPPLRLALVQSWIMMEQDRSEFMLEDRDELAAALAAPDSTHRLWSEFAHWRVTRWRNVLPGFVTDASRRGFVSTPALVGVDLEAVLVSETSGGTRKIHAGGPVEVQRFLVRHAPDLARLAGIGGVLPIPGWPPSETDRMPH